MNEGKAGPPKHLTIAVVICTKDRETDLRSCLDTLATQTRMPEQLVVVDSGSDGSESVVRAFGAAHTGIRMDYLRSTPSLTRQRNLGIGQAVCEVIAFLDDDVLLEPDYLEEITRAFMEGGGEEAVGVNPRVSEPKPASPLSRRVRRLFGMSRTDGAGQMQPSGFGTMTWDAPFTDLHDIEVASGVAAYRRSLFEHVQFDEHFDGYGYMEDQEFAYRASRIGRLVGNPRARLFHNFSVNARLDRRTLTEMQVVNHYYVFRKHLPQDAYHWFCFWWSELGELLYRSARTIRFGHRGELAGAISGCVKVLSGRAARDFGLEGED